MPNVENEGWNPIYGACSSKCVFPMCVIWKRWCTKQRSGLCCQSCPSCRENMMWKKAFSVWFASPFCSEMQGKAELRPQNLHQSYILHLILHLILHPKSSVNTTCLGHGCRKCRRFSKNFGSASIWVIDMFLHGSSICLIINILTSKKVVDVRIFLYLCMWKKT